MLNTRFAVGEVGDVGEVAEVPLTLLLSLSTVLPTAPERRLTLLWDRGVSFEGRAVLVGAAGVEGGLAMREGGSTRESRANYVGGQGLAYLTNTFRERVHIYGSNVRTAVRN